ncbi:hypothetical protein ACQ4M3_35240 [Leptolyngbya sp. AN03gr2]|uniref:hypothetical protein n=1 Tax=unclassified Leptolyngbya TaxID=2650499 RepID=UPI003D32111F
MEWMFEIKTAKDLVPFTARELFDNYFNLKQYHTYDGQLTDNPIVKIKSCCPGCRDNSFTRSSSYQTGSPRHRELRTEHWKTHHLEQPVKQGVLEWILGLGNGSGRKITKYLTPCDQKVEQSGKFYTWKSFEQFVQDNFDLITEYDQDEKKRWEKWDNHVKNKIKDWENRLQTEIPNFPSVTKIEDSIKSWFEQNPGKIVINPFNPLATKLFSESLTPFLEKLQTAIAICDETNTSRLYAIQVAIQDYWTIIEDLISPRQLIKEKREKDQFQFWQWGDFKSYFETKNLNFQPNGTSLCEGCELDRCKDQGCIQDDLTLNTAANYELEILDKHLETGERCLLLTGIIYEHIIQLIEYWKKTEEIEDWDFIAITSPGDCNSSDLMVTIIEALIQNYEYDVQKFLPAPKQGGWWNQETRHFIPKTLTEQRNLVRNLFKKLGKQKLGFIVRQAGFLKRPAWQELIALHEACNVPILMIIAGSPQQNWSANDIELFRANATIHSIRPQGWEAIKLYSKLN